MAYWKCDAAVLKARLTACTATLPPAGHSPAWVHIEALMSVPNPDAVPPWLTARLAAAAGAPDPDGLGLIIAASYAAAHLADDLADGDASPAAWATGNLDCVRLLVLAQSLVDRLQGADRSRESLRAEFSRAILEMCTGQQADLSNRERLGADAWEIAEGKSGAGFGGYLAMAALVSGADQDRWRAAGQQFGVLAQAASDAYDLFGTDSSEDWQGGLSSVALQLGLQSTVGDRLRVLLAGPRAQTLGPARVLLGRCDDFWQALERGLTTRQRALQEICNPDPVLGELVRLGESLIQGAVALRDRAQRRIWMAWMTSWSHYRAQAIRFLDTDLALTEAITVHRWGLGGRESVCADAFGRLVILEAIAGLGVAVHGELDHLRQRAQTWGWRYFGDFPRIPPDIDTTGLALLVLGEDAGPGLAEAILDDPQPSGLLHTWRPHARCRDSLPWDPRPCPVATANALVGVDRVGVWGPRASAALQAIVAWAHGEALHTSLYPVSVARGWILLSLCRLRHRGADPAAILALSDTILSSLTLGYRSLSVLGLALSIRGLRAAGATLNPSALLAALGERMDVDGGFAADPFFPSVAPGIAGEPSLHPRFYRSRLVTTAQVLAATSGWENHNRGVRASRGLFG